MDRFLNAFREDWRPFFHRRQLRCFLLGFGWVFAATDGSGYYLLRCEYVKKNPLKNCQHAPPHHFCLGLHCGLSQAREDPGANKRIENTSFLVVGNAPEPFVAQIKAEYDVYRKVLDFAKLRLQWLRALNPMRPASIPL